MYFDNDIHKTLVNISDKLGLKPHLVSKEETEMALCGDIEIHQISPNVFYALDLARVFPPALTKENSPPGCIFYRMLRPELLKMLKKEKKFVFIK